MQTNHSRQIREMQQKHGRKIADKGTRHFDERQTATLVKGKPLEYAGELYSRKHRRRFTTEKAGFQVLKNQTNGTK